MPFKFAGSDLAAAYRGGTAVDKFYLGGTDLGSVGVPPPPIGFAYLIGADGAYLKGADGSYLLGAA